MPASLEQDFFTFDGCQSSRKATVIEVNRKAKPWISGIWGDPVGPRKEKGIRVRSRGKIIGRFLDFFCTEERKLGKGKKKIFPATKRQCGMKFFENRIWLTGKFVEEVQPVKLLIRVRTRLGRG